MKYQNGITRDEPSLKILDAEKNGKEFAYSECILILALCIATVLIPIFGLFGIGS
jgi:hypothetical protein